MAPLDKNSFDLLVRDTPDWLAVRRDEGYSHFDKLAMPTSREEAWRYVDLDFDLDDLTLADLPGPAIGADDVLADSIGDLAGAAHIVDGIALSVESDAAADVVFSSIAAAIVDRPVDLMPFYGSLVPADFDKFAAAHRAFGTDGVFLSVPTGRAIERPFYVDIQAATTGTVSFPGLSVVLADRSEASVVVNYRSPMEGSHVVVPHLELTIGDGSHLKLTIVQNWGYATSSVAQARVTVGRDGSLRMAEAGLGGKLSRLHLTVDLEGRGSSAELLGAYFGEERQVLDYRYVMHHSGTNTNSNMFLKGAVEDEALSVFTGMIRIDEGAQRTDAYQTNRNLILSEGAAAQSVPNLEILANDVRCGHGSTVGPLDDEQRYYLMSRGLSRPRADRLQVRGFFEEAISRFPESGVADPVRQWINAKYVAAQEEGRV